MVQREPTEVQKWMIGLMGCALLFFGAWLVPETVGVLSSGSEDTFSEWVWDLPLWAVLTASAISGLIGFLAVWAAGHFIEGWARRRKK